MDIQFIYPNQEQNGLSVTSSVEGFIIVSSSRDLGGDIPRPVSGKVSILQN